MYGYINLYVGTFGDWKRILDPWSEQPDIH